MFVNVWIMYFLIERIGKKKIEIISDFLPGYLGNKPPLRKNKEVKKCNLNMGLKNHKITC